MPHTKQGLKRETKTLTLLDVFKGKTKMQRERGETQKKEFDELMGQKQIKIRHTYRDRNMQIDNTDKV